MKRVYFPQSIAAYLEEKSKASGVPISRLVVYAVDNELDAPVPFNYPTDLPATEYVQYAYADEAAKIAKFLSAFASGTGRDTLLVSRRDIGVPNADALLCGLRELIREGVVEEVTPPQSVKFKYPVGYKYVKLKGIARNTVINRKRKMIAALQAEIEAEEQAFNERKRDYVPDEGDDDDTE